MKKDDPVVHCLLIFFQNLETVGVPKKEKQTSSPANVFLHKGFRVDYKHMRMHTHRHKYSTCGRRQFPVKLLLTKQ